MNIRFKIAWLVLFVCLGIDSRAQELYNSLKPLTTAANTLNYKLTGNQYNFWPTLNGTVYLNNDWVHCDVTLENGDVYKDIYVRLNTYWDELIFYNERVGSVIVLDKTIIDEFELKGGAGSHGLFRKVYFDKLPKGDRYVNVLFDGKVKLYLWNQTLVVKTSVYRDNYIHGGLRDSEYKQELNYFVVFPDNSFYKVTTKRHSFVQLFPDDKRVVRRLFRKNKIHFYSPDDIIKATQVIEQEFF